MEELYLHRQLHSILHLLHFLNNSCFSEFSIENESNCLQLLTEQQATALHFIVHTH